MPDEVGARLDPGSLRKLIQASRTWDAVSRREMRAGLRAAAQTGMEAAKAEVLGPVPSKANQRGRLAQKLGLRARYGSGHGGSGLRSGLASGVSVSIQAGVRSEGVRVTTSSKGLDADRAPMVKAYMAGTFRHPVFGNRKVFANQHGKNWFYSPLMAGRDQYQKAIVAAIEKASEAIARD